MTSITGRGPLGLLAARATTQRGLATNYLDIVHRGHLDAST
jgi:hypothetical protein